MNDSGKPAEGILSSILAATSDSMLAELRAIRAGFSHTGVVGTSVEEIVSKILNSRLPGSARAVAGQVIDHAGVRSRQMDVVIYDASRTPMLFASSVGTQNLVPAEGVIAVVEVKTKLTPGELRKSAENCKSVKRLNRSALATHQILKEFNLYGQRWIVPPIFYSVFAFESDGLYAEALNDEIDQGIRLEDRIDSLVCLDRGVCLNGTATVVGSGSEALVQTYFSACPGPESVRMSIETSGALTAWYGVFMSTVLERIPGPEIDITRYLAEELQFSGKVGAGPTVQAMTDRIKEGFAAAIELNSALMQKFASGRPLSASELYQLMSHPMYYPGQDAAPGLKKRLEILQQSARALSRNDWLATWFPDQDPDQPFVQG